MPPLSAEDAAWHRRRYGWVPGEPGCGPPFDRGGLYTKDGRRIVYLDEDGRPTETIDPGDEGHYNIRETD